MNFHVQYSQLVHVEVLHQYYLDQGETSWQSMSEEGKARQLDTFNLSNFLQIIPSMKTVRELAGHQLVFKRNATGFSVWTKLSPNGDNHPFVELDDKLALTFLLRQTDPFFYNYTDLLLADARSLYYFSNQRSVTEAQLFPYIRKSGGNSAVTAQFIISGEGRKNELVQLSTAEQSNLFGIIRLYMKGANSSLNLTQTQGRIADVAPGFELQFRNRKTLWRYNFRSDQQVHSNDDVRKESGNARVLVTKSEYPLTKTGFIPVHLDGRDLPNPDARMITPGDSTNTFYSEIYL